MIIECINCNKKFEIDAALIPDEGRTLNVALVNHVWFYKKNFRKNSIDNFEIEKKL